MTDFLELEEVSESFQHNSKLGLPKRCDENLLVPSGKLQIPTSAKESPTSEELPMITPLTKESTQNVLDTNISTQDASTTLK